MNKYLSGYINLLKTAMGSGILSYPFLFKTYGYVMVTFVSILAASFSYFGLFLYLSCMKKVGPGSTFSSIALCSSLNSSTLADIAICIKCIGVAISYLIIIRQLLPLVVVYILKSDIYIKPKLFLLIFLLITSPLSYFTKINKLRYTSMCGLVCIFVVVFTSFFRFSNTAKITNDIVPITPLSILWITGLGKIVFSFTCHQNIFTVHNELNDNNIKKSSILAFMTVLTALCVYLIFGFTNYLIYGSQINVDILETYPGDTMTTIIQGLYVIIMGFSYPLQINPCKLYLIELLGFSNHKNIYWIKILITTILLVITYSVAASGVNLDLMYSLIGSIASSLVCMILPSIFYKSIIGRGSRFYILSNVLLVFGIMIFFSSIASIDIFNTKN